MATFPELEPNTRSYDFGTVPLTEQSSFNAAAARFKHGDTPQNYELELGYTALTDAQAILIRQHFQSQASSYLSFLLPSVIWKGHTFTGNVVPPSTRWRYLEEPSEEHLSIGYVNVTVKLGSDGIDRNAFGPDPISLSFVGGAGFSNDGIAPAFSRTITASLVAGEPFGDIYLGIDPSINKVTLLLHFNGANGSTVKTDSSYYAQTVVDDSPGADSIISTTQSKYGGASLYMDGTTSLIVDNPATGFRSDEVHTVEFWFRPDVGLTPFVQRGLCSLRDNDTGTPSINLSYTDLGSSLATVKLQVNPPLILKQRYQVLSASYPPRYANVGAWNHIAYSFSGTRYYLFVNGYQAGGGIIDAIPITVGRILRIGTAVNVDIGANPSLPYTETTLAPAIGYMDDFRITKGDVRYWINDSYAYSFTPPISQHPDP